MKKTYLLFILLVFYFSAFGQQDTNRLDDEIDTRIRDMILSQTKKLSEANEVYMFALKISITNNGKKIRIDSISSSNATQAALLLSHLSELKMLNYQKLVGQAKKIMIIKPIILFVNAKNEEAKSHKMYEVFKKGVDLMYVDHRVSKYQPEDIIYKKTVLKPFVMQMDLNVYD